MRLVLTHRSTWWGAKAKVLDHEITSKWWAWVFTWRQGSWDGTGVCQRQTNTQPCHLGERPGLAFSFIGQSLECRFRCPERKFTCYYCKRSELRSGQWSRLSSDYELEIRSRSYCGVKVLILSRQWWWWGPSDTQSRRSPEAKSSGPGRLHELSVDPLDVGAAEGVSSSP